MNQQDNTKPTNQRKLNKYRHQSPKNCLRYITIALVINPCQTLAAASGMLCTLQLPGRGRLISDVSSYWQNLLLDQGALPTHTGYISSLLVLSYIQYVITMSNISYWPLRIWSPVMYFKNVDVVKVEIRDGPTCFCYMNLAV